ncbi:hypothetical protein H9I45_12550 [Polaribacter haliotis]|uniref:Lipoprotein n=1 Tax=Polaribacter haliotis TaxID=1888915 RepID=A0A7L8ADV5_9FLAO|nr:hypothetical protein [Polaribacter haliotis]QOD60165.1 hypothetical protein H9I45_12550 [Polaribacter haliotis]
MKTIKKITAVLALLAVLFTSCSDTKKTNEAFKTVKIELADGNTVNYKLGTTGTLSFDDWKGYNTINSELYEIERMDLVATTAKIEEMQASIANLGNTIPAWLRTEEVLEDIDDVQEEYQKLLKEKNEPVKNVKQNLEELIEKFDDLREELNETIDKYKK